MYTCERLGENATKFKYASVDGGIRGAGGHNGNGGAWMRGAVVLAGAGLLVQVFTTSWAAVVVAEVHSLAVEPQISPCNPGAVLDPCAMLAALARARYPRT